MKMDFVFSRYVCVRKVSWNHRGQGEYKFIPCGVINVVDTKIYDSYIMLDG